MATVVTYGGIKLNNVVTRQWDEEIIYDQSGTDAIHQKFRLAFEGILYVKDVQNAQMQWIDSQAGSGGSNIATLQTYVRSRLSQPRQELYVRIVENSLDHGGIPVDVILLHCRPPQTSYDHWSFVDVDNGPKPRNVVVSQIVADKVMRISFTIECALVECVNQAVVPVIINNRWSVGEEMDENFFSTKTIRGRLRLSNALASPHQWKPVVMPPQEPGFKRQRVSFVASENGLEAEYEIVDRQVHTSAPWPATSINGTYSQTTTDGIVFSSEVDVELQGSPSATRSDLLTRALQVVDAKLGITKLTDNDFIYEQFAIMESIGPENMVKILARIKHIGTETKEYLSNLRTKYLAQPLKLPSLKGAIYDPRVSLSAWPYGENPQGGQRAPQIGLYLLHCLVQSPCATSASKTIFGQTYIPADTEEATKDYPKVQGYIVKGPLPLGKPDYYDTSHKEAIYTSYTLQSRYINERSRLQLPLADPDIDESKDDTCIVAEIANGQCRREITLEGERVGQWPAIPEPVDHYTDGSLRATLLRHSVTPHAPRLSADGRKQVFEIEAEYIYALNRPPRADESRRVGVLPFSKLTETDTAYVASDLYAPRLSP